MSKLEQKGVDFGRRSGDYGKHRPGFPPSFYDRIETWSQLAHSTVLDVGTGPGILALELARRGATVVGIDVSENQIEVADQRAADAGLQSRCNFLVGRVEDTGLMERQFDLVTAGQCWVWFDESAAMVEVRRVLKPGGILVVAHYCYLSLHSEIAKATEELILRFNPSWTMAGHNGLYPRHIDSLVLGGFELVEQFCYDHDRLFTHEAWRGRMRTCNGVGSGTLSDEQVAQFDDDLAALLEEAAPGDPFAVRHRIWATVVRRPRE